MLKVLLTFLKIGSLSSLLIGETIFGAANFASYETSSMARWTFKDGTVSATVFNDPEVTVVSPTQAQEIFQNLASKSYIPYSYTPDGCEARAHEMSMVADNWKLKTGKMFLVGALINGWQYHVAPFVLVNSNSGLVPYILDPSTQKMAVPFDVWTKAMIGFNFSYHSLFVTSRFIYRSSDRNINIQHYTVKDYAKTNAGLIYFNLLNSSRLFN